MRSTLFATMAGLVLLATPLLVERDRPAPGYGERKRIAAGEVLGKTMVSAAGIEIGRVSDVRQGQDGRVEALLVDHDNRIVAVAPDRVQYARNETVRTSLSAEEVAELPDASTQ